MSGRNSDSEPTRRSVLRTTGAAGVVVTTGLAGCSENGGGNGDGNGNGGGNGGGNGNGNGGGNGNGSASIEVTGVWSGAEQEDFMAVVDRVQEQTGHEISYSARSTDALLSGTLMDYESETAPADIVVMPSPARVINDGEAGHLEPVGDVWNADDFAVDPERVSAGGEVYAAPFKMDLKPGFWYRKSFFDDNDLSVPESYDDFLSLLDTISGIDGVDAPIASGNGDGWPLSDITEGFFMRQENGDQLQQNLISGDADFTDDRVQSAFEDLRTLHQEGYFSTVREFGTQYEYFWENSIPLYYMGSFTPAQDAIQDASDLGVFRLPETNGIGSSVNWFTVPTYSDNVEAAKEALGEFVSAESQQVWVERGGFIASNINVPQDAYELEVMASLPQLANEVSVVPDLDDALGNPFQGEFWSQLKGFWQDPSSDIGSIQESLEQTQNESLEE